MIIESIKAVNCKNLSYIKGIEKIGDCILENSGIISFGELSFVNLLYLRKCNKIKTLGKIIEIRTLDIKECSLSSLGNLQSLGRLIHDSDIKLKSLGKLYRLDKQEQHGVSLFYHFSAWKDLEDLGMIKHFKSLSIRDNTKIRSLNYVEEIDEELTCYGSNIEDLGNLKKVGMSISLKNCKNISSLGNLEEVNGVGIDLDGSSITDLGMLKKCNRIYKFPGDKSKYPQFKFVG